MSAIPDISGYVQQARAAELPPATARAGATAGDPHESAVVLVKDGAIEIGIWECSPGVFPGARVGYNELMGVVQGAGTITTDGGEPVALGDGLVFPTLDGWRGEWNVTETVRKVYVIWGDTR